MKTIRTEKIGKNTLRLVDTGKGISGVIVSGGKQLVQLDGTDPAELWAQLLAAVGKTSPEYFGFEGARARFLKHFPGGFTSEEFVGWERQYKLEAKAKLDAALPLDKAIDGSGMGPAALSAFQASNLLSVFEKTKLSPLLKGANADAFVQAAARFAMGEYKPALATLERIARPFESAKWTVITYLPFLWLPETHMFLKPAVTQDFAERVGHRFVRDYSAQLDASVYESLLDLAGQTSSHLADLSPHDNIDIQSLIWIVGAYKEDDGPEAEASA